MRYIVNNEEVSRNTFYFCQKAKEENKTFVLLKPIENLETNLNRHPGYDYYIRDSISAYYTKGKATTNEWFTKDDCFICSRCTPEDMTKRYQKSKFKDIMTFKEWYTKNGWKYHSETKYESEYHDIPTAGDFKEDNVRIKLFSVTVDNIDTVKTINKIRDERGNFSIKYVLRDNKFTEIIYQDTYKEI